MEGVGGDEVRKVTGALYFPFTQRSKTARGFLSRRLTFYLHIRLASGWRLTVGTPSTEARKTVGRLIR